MFKLCVFFTSYNTCLKLSHKMQNMQVGLPISTNYVTLCLLILITYMSYNHRTSLKQKYYVDT